MQYFTNGESYLAQADIQRVVSIEDSLDVFMKITDGGVIQGWSVYQDENLSTENPFFIKVESGVGIIEIDDSYSTDSEIASNTPSPHYIGVRTNSDIDLANPSVGASRISVVYIELNPTYVDQFTSLFTGILPFSITLGSGANATSLLVTSEIERWSALGTLTEKEKEITVSVLPGAGDKSSDGAYRNLSPQTEYPVYKYNINGADFDVSKFKYSTFINGKAYKDADFTVNKNMTVTFDLPLEPQDSITMRIEPKYGLIIAEIETDENGIIRIDNSVKSSVYEKVGDDLVAKYITNHVHDALDGVSSSKYLADKVLLTTETSLLSHEETSDFRVFVFNKTFSEDFNFSFNEGTYYAEVYVNDLLSVDPYTLSDDGSKISVLFDNPLSSAAVVRLKLRIKDIYTHVKNKLEINDSNASKDRIDIAVDGSDFGTGTFDDERIPKISHVGLYKKALEPTNSTDLNSKEYLHRTESFNVALGTLNIEGTYGQEFFPVVNEKSNARDAKFMYVDLDGDIVYACAGSNLLYYRKNPESYDNGTTIREYLSITGEYPSSIDGKTENLFIGWDVISFDGIRSAKSNDLMGEYSSPFYIAPITNSYLWANKKHFVFSDKFVNMLDWDSSNNPIVTEISNISGDSSPQSFKNHIDFPDIFSSIIDVVSGEGIMNLDGDNSSVYVLASNGHVYVYEYSRSARGGTWLDITGTPSWLDGDTVLSSSLSYVTIGSDKYLFVGTTDGSVYINKMVSVKIENNLSANTSFTVNGSVGSTDLSIFDDVIITTDSASENNKVANIQTNYIVLNQSVVNSYSGQSTEGIFESVLLSGWVLIGSSLSGSVKKVLYAYDNLFILTDDTIYFTEFDGSTLSLTWESFSSPSLNNFTDMAPISDDSFLLSGQNGVHLAIFDGDSFIVSNSTNSVYGESLNSFLTECTSINVDEELRRDENVGYVCGKYGIFQTTDGGSSWRNTLQILGIAEDKNNPYLFSKASLNVTGYDDTIHRIYIEDFDAAYGYGYGYGYGGGYYDVLLPQIEDTGLGYGDTGYGYGYELKDPTVGIVENDYIFLDDGFHSRSPMRVLGVGSDGIGYYVDVEKTNGYQVDLSNDFVGLRLSVYDFISPLAFINNEPQDTKYENSDVTSYTFDFYKQSIYFSESTSFGDDVNIASQYKSFTPCDNFDISNIEFNGDDDNKNLKILYNGINLTGWTKSGSVINIPYGFNKNKIVKITATGLVIYDAGKYSHEEIEDEISEENTGLPYRFDSSRSSNFLATLMGVRHIYTATSNAAISGTITGVTSSPVSGDPFIEDSAQSFTVDALIGRKIIINSDSKTYDFTISDNNATDIYLQRQYTFRKYSVTSTTQTQFDLDGNAVSGSISVYVDGVLNLNWSEVTVEGLITAINFTSAPGVSNVHLLFVESDNAIDISDIASIGNAYQISEVSVDFDDNLIDVYTSSYEDDNYPINNEKCFIENSYVTDIGSINENPGSMTSLMTYLFYDEDNEDLLAGTNTGVWINGIGDFVFSKTNPMLDTIDASGSATIPEQVNGAYIQYDKTTEEWTVTWGSGINNKDENENLSKTDVRCVSCCPNNANVILIGTDSSIYRSLDAGTTWTVIWDTEIDPRTKDHPEIVSIVFDDKHPWVVNAVLFDGLYRSYNYGNSWERVFEGNINTTSTSACGAFSYQVDDSDSRTAYYFGQNGFLYKPEANFGLNEKVQGNDWFVKKYWGRKKIGDGLPFSFVSRTFENGFGFPDITGIINLKSNVNEVFLGTNGSGLYKTEILGYSPDIYFDTELSYDSPLGNTSYKSNTSFSNSTTTREDRKILAFGDLLDSYFDVSDEDEYHAFVDYGNRKTYVSVEVDPSKRRVPVDGDLVGYGVRLSDINNKYYKILEHYDRGVEPGNYYYQGNHSENLETRRIEFVLDGVWEEGTFFRYDVGRTELTKEDSDGNKQYHVLRGDFKNERWFNLGIFGKKHGRITKPKLQDLSRVYCVKYDLFNSGTDETVFIVQFDDLSQVPSFLQVDETILAGYYIGGTKQGNQYLIYESQQLTSGPYYVNDGRYQYACRMENESNSFSDVNDPYNLWHRVNHSELHNVVLHNQIYESEGDTDGNDLHYTCVVRGSNFSEDTNHKEDLVWVGFDPSWSALWPFTSSDYAYGYGYGYGEGLDYFNVLSDAFTNYGYGTSSFETDFIDQYGYGYGYEYLGPLPSSYFVGKYIGHPGSGYKYKIIDATLLQPGDDFYELNFPDEYNQRDSSLSSYPLTSLDYKYLFRVEPFTKSYSNCSLFSSGTISLLSSTTVTVSHVGDGLPDLTGFSLRTSSSESAVIYKIQSSGTNTIDLYKTNVDDLFANFSNILIGYNIDGNIVQQIGRRESGGNEYIYISTEGGIYESSDGGENWKSYVDNLTLRTYTGLPSSIFSDFNIYGSRIYAITNTTTSVAGVYWIDLEGSATWSKMTDGSSEDLSTLSPSSISVSSDGVVFVGTAYGVYKAEHQSVSWTWDRMYLPENDINTVLAIDNDINLQPSDLKETRYDLDRLWIGTEGHGLYRREKENRNSEKVNTNWEKTSSSRYDRTEIISSNWIINDVADLTIDTVGIEVLAYENDIDRWRSDKDAYSTRFFTESTVGETFDWSAYGDGWDIVKTEDDFILIDPDNVHYVSRIMDEIQTSTFKRSNHQMQNFTSNIEGFGRGEKNLISENLIGSIKRKDITNRTDNKTLTSIYEQPFNHMPDMKSITVIRQTSDGTVIIGTDRDGIWRTKRRNSSGIGIDGAPGFVMPIPNGDNGISDNEFGYDFEIWKHTIISISVAIPTSPSTGKYIVGSGDWSAHPYLVSENDIAEYNGTIWISPVTPTLNLRVWITAEATGGDVYNGGYTYNGATWVAEGLITHNGIGNISLQPWFPTDGDKPDYSGDDVYIGEKGDRRTPFYTGIINSATIRRLYDYSKNFYHIREKKMAYTAYSGFGNGVNGSDFFTDIDNLEDYTDLIGGYFVVSEKMNEIYGPRVDPTSMSDYDVRVYQITDIEYYSTTDSGLDRNAYYLTLSEGQAYGINTDQNKPIGYGDRWGNDWDFRHKDEWGAATSGYKGTDAGWDDSRTSRFCILDFEKYEKISVMNSDTSKDLPVISGLYNTNGNEDSAVFVRDISIGSDDKAYVACGINGVYKTNDILATTVEWSKITFKHPSTNLDIDATCVLYDADTASASVGTWGDGIFLINSLDQVFEKNTDLNHKKIWSLFNHVNYGYGYTYGYQYGYDYGYNGGTDYFDALNPDSIYAGTEHGGVYKYNSALEKWSRETSGVVRSQIDSWKVSGVDSQFSGDTDYTYSDYLVAYSWGAGVMRSLNRGVSWVQADINLNNLYIQDVIVTPSVVYVATCGGGVFYSSDFFTASFEDISWTQISIFGLPDGLNVCELSSGTNTNVIFAKFRENSLSGKDIPYFMRKRYVNEELDSTKHIKDSIYKATFANGSWTWIKIYDKDPELTIDYTFESVSTGLVVVPGTEKDIRFIYRFSNDGNIYKNLYVSINSNLVITEKEFPFDIFETNNFEILDVSLSIDPLDTNVVYAAISPVDVNQSNRSDIYASALNYKLLEPQAIVRTDDNGTSWSNDLTPDDMVSGFNTQIQTSSKTSGRIFANFDHKVYLSTNKGVSWVSISNIFDNPSVKVMGVVVDPDSSDERYLIFEYMGSVYLYHGDDDITPDASLFIMSVGNLKERCLSIGEISGQKRLYISEKDKVRYVTFDISGEIDATTVVYSGEVSSPLVISEHDNNYMMFVSGKTLHFTVNAFTTEGTSTLEFDGNEISRIVIGSGSSYLNETFICVDAQYSFKKVQATTSDIYESGIQEVISSNTISVSGNTETFTIGDTLEFANDNFAAAYSTKITYKDGREESLIGILPTISGDVYSAVYDGINDRTIITAIIDADSTDSYDGNYLQIFDNSRFTNEIYNGRFNFLSFDESGDFLQFYVSGDLISLFNNYDVDLSSSFPYVRIGRVSDFLPSTFFSGGKVFVRKRIDPKNNGLWYSGTGGVGFNKIDFSDFNLQNKGCQNAFSFGEDGEIVVSFNDGKKTKILVNDWWMPSDEINGIDLNDNGYPLMATTNGVSFLNVGYSAGYFRNFYFNDFENIFRLDSSEYFLSTSTKNYMLQEELSGLFNGDDVLTEFTKPVGTVNKVIKDSNSIYWFATDNGLKALLSNGEIETFFENEQIKDVIEDTHNRIWATRKNGCSMIIYYNTLTNFSSRVEWVNYSEGISGDVEALYERTGLDYESDGDPDGTSPLGDDTPYISLSWTNISVVYPKSVIVRSDTYDVNLDLNGRAFSSSINGIISSIESETVLIGGVSTETWKITPESLVSYDTDSLIGKYIFINSREFSTKREILENSTNTFNIQKTSGETAPTSSGKNFMIVDVVESDDYSLFVGSETSYIDYSVIVGTSYYYNLFVYNDITNDYIWVSSEAISAGTSKSTKNSSEILCGGQNGLFILGNSGFIKEFSTGNTINHISSDSTGALWLSSGYKIVRYTPNEYNSFNRRDLFGSLVTGSLSITGSVEAVDGKVYISTNLGLASYDLSTKSFEVYIENDVDRKNRGTDGFILTSDWHVSTVFDGTLSEFARLDGSNSAYLLRTDGLYKTESSGLDWSVIVEEDQNGKYIVYGEDSGTKENYVILGDDYYRKIKTTEFTDDYYFFGEEFPSLEYDDSSVGSPSYIYLSDSDTDEIIFAGIYNNFVIENEVEIARMQIENNIVTTTLLGSSVGLSEQSTYSFTSIGSTVYAGCKDNILLREDSGTWRIVHYDNTNPYLSKNGEPYAFTCLDSRLDTTNAIDSDINGKKVVYASRTPLYPISITDKYIRQDIISFRVGLDESDELLSRYETVMQYDLSESMMDVGAGTDIVNIDKAILESYQSQIIRSNLLYGHVGAVKYIDEQKSILAGGFDNSLFLIPFTAEKKTLIGDYDWINTPSFTKRNTCLLSGRRTISGSIFPQSNLYPYYLESYKLQNLSGRRSILPNSPIFNLLTYDIQGNMPYTFDYLLRPKVGLSVYFDGDNGYASVMQFAENEDKVNSNVVSMIEGTYSYIGNNDVCSVLRSDDGGMIWQPFLSSSSAVTGFYKNGNSLIVSSSYGDGTDNVGLFTVDSDRNLDAYTVSNYPSIPFSFIKESGGTVFAGTNGFGLYSIEDSTVSQYQSRFVTQDGYNSGKWQVTSIAENHNDRKKVHIGTKQQGILYSSDVTKNLDSIKWSFDNDGLPVAEITKLATLRTNPDVVLAGVKDNGLYKKNLVSENYEHITEGIPSIGNVNQILVDNEVLNTYITFTYNYSLSNDLYIIRSTFRTFDGILSDSTVYVIGDEIANGEVVYAGDGDFTSNLYSDTSSDLRSNAKYYYKFYQRNNSEYKEVDDFSGSISSRSGMVFTMDTGLRILGGDSSIKYIKMDSYYVDVNRDEYTEDSSTGNILDSNSDIVLTRTSVSPVVSYVDSVGGVYTQSSGSKFIDWDGETVDLTGRILKVSLGPLENQKRRYRITSNTSSTMVVEFDSEFKELNNARWDKISSYRGLNYTVESTIGSQAITSNPIYIVYQEEVESANGISRVYVSNDNGEQWTVKNLVTAYESNDFSVNNIAVTHKFGSIYNENYATIYAAANDGVYKSVNSGATWDRISTDISSSYYNGLPSLSDVSLIYKYVFTDRKDRNIVYAINNSGDIYRTINGGISWSLLYETGLTINDAVMVSYFKNRIMIGSDQFGLNMLNDSVRQTTDVKIDSDGKINDFSVEDLEIGDEIITDSNSILAKTISRNDEAQNSQETVTFKTSSNTKYLSFSFKSDDILFDTEDIYIGSLIENPNSNPFVLHDPGDVSSDMIVHTIGSLGSQVYALTTKGAYLTSNSGGKWQKIYSEALPDEIYDIDQIKDSDEISLGTNDGFWISENDKKTFRQIESDGEEVRVVWEEGDRHFRGGSDGLYITLSGTKSLVVYSGSKTYNEFSWGDLFSPNDGGFSNETDEILNIPIYKSPSPNADSIGYDDWDYVLVVRRGPFVTYEDALASSDIFKPSNNVVYPSNLSNETQYNTEIDVSPEFIFSGDNSSLNVELNAGSLEIIRFENQEGDGAIGSIFSPSNETVYMGGGNIIVGVLKNRRGNPPGTGFDSNFVSHYGYSSSDIDLEENLPYDFGPTSANMILDKIQPLGSNFSSSQRSSAGLVDNYASTDAEYDTDTTSPLYGRVKCPEIVENSYYMYRAYPYRMVPDSTQVGLNSDGSAPVYPRYLPLNGDIPDSYTYKISIEKFYGSNNILSGISVSDANWVIGTDVGIFYSTEKGMDVNKSNIVGRVPAIIYTSANTLLASVVLKNGRIQIVTSTDKANWTVISELNEMIYNLNINKVYNFTEYNDKIYMSSSAGFFGGDLDGSNWIFYGDIGDHEVLNAQRLLGQEFRVL